MIDSGLYSRSCRYCWWYKNGYCRYPDLSKESDVPANGVCGKFKNQKTILARLFDADVIVTDDDKNEKE